MLYLIGLGLGWKDISLKALECLNNCEAIYLESYTSISDFSLLQLQRLIGKQIQPLERKDVEEMFFLESAATRNIALLVYGDPLAATTHQEILFSAKKKSIDVKVVHAPSIFTAVSQTGLSLYKFGKVASIPFSEPGFEPESYFDVLVDNLKIGAHTLFLLDLKPKENKFLTIPEAIEALLKIDVKRKANLFTKNKLVIGCARLGFEDPLIKFGTAEELSKVDFGKPPFCLIVPAELNHKEAEYTKLFS